MKNYLTQINLDQQQTPQSAPMPGTNQVANSAGGYAWAVDKWERLRRFLILGSEGGSYYARQQTLTLENTNNVLACIREDEAKTVDEIVAISEEGRAPKNDPAIFALALAASAGETRRPALNALPRVCRTATHLFTFAEYIKGMRGWGRALRRAIGEWYLEKDERKLAYQMVKYRQRNGWTHTDLLRLAHPMPVSTAQGDLFKWVTADEKPDWVSQPAPPEDETLAFVWAFEKAQAAPDVESLLRLIEAYDLPREALPTQFLKEPAIWEALLPKMPITALIRNLSNMSRAGLIQPFSDAENFIVDKLADAEVLRKGRVHPIALLSALRVYELGFSLKGRTSPNYYGRSNRDPEWTPTPRIIDALDGAFELAFRHIEPTGKRLLLALDVSGSMAYGMIAGVPGLTPRDASAALALVTARTERNYTIVAFQDKLVPLAISANMRLGDVINQTHGLPFGATDCAQPMLYALKNKIPVDTFIIYTDSETWFGNIHPAEALRKYRDTMGIAARLIVVGMTANDFSIADPDDPGMLDVVGFDTASPAIMADFARGRL